MCVGMAGRGCLPTTPILSALLLQGLKSNIYVHFQFVKNNWLGLHSESETINEGRN